MNQNYCWNRTANQINKENKEWKLNSQWNEWNDILTWNKPIRVKTWVSWTIDSIDWLLPCDCVWLCKKGMMAVTAAPLLFCSCCWQQRDGRRKEKTLVMLVIIVTLVGIELNWNWIGIEFDESSVKINKCRNVGLGYQFF